MNCLPFNVQTALIGLGGLTGFLCWGHEGGLFPEVIVAVLFAVGSEVKSRFGWWGMWLGYFLAGARGLPGGAAVFFGDSAPWMGYSLWIGSSLLLSMSFLFFWSSNPRFRAFGVVAAIVLDILPPLGIIGWLSPVVVAGAFFPGMGWMGVVLMLAFAGLLVSGCWRWVGGVFVISLVANLIAAVHPVSPPPGWSGLDTHFSRLSSGNGADAGQILASIHRISWLSKFAAGVGRGSVVVLPETLLGELSGVSAFELNQVSEDLSSRGSRVIVGAELPVAGGPGGRYENALVVLGGSGSEGKFVQGIPVPVSMWRPWAADGAVADIFEHSNVVEVGGRRVAAVICYEELLAYSYLWSMGARPDLLVGAANVWWARDTSIPAIQRQTLASFGRLFGVPVVRAANY